MIFYWLKATIYGGAFYSIYYLLLRNYTSYRWNRYYLLATAIVPVLLPLFVFPEIGNNMPVLTQQFTIYLPLIEINTHKSTAIGFTVLQLLQTVYLLVAVVLLIRVLLLYRLIVRVARTSIHKESLPDGIMLLQHTGYGPGSFGKYIFIPSSHIHPDILQHELAHIKFRHSYDLFIIEVFKAVCWIFPVTHIAASELKIIHEFEADSAVDTDPNGYGRLLLSEVFGVKHIQIAHSFFNHPIKRRLAMLQQKSLDRTKVRTAIFRSGLATLMLTTGIIYLQSCSREQKPGALPAAHATTKEEAYSTVDKMPEASFDIPKYLGENIRYPQQAKDQKIEGRVIVKFVVDKEGNITNPSVVKSPSPLLSEEAIRVIKTMPRWKPGIKDGQNVPVNFFIPISFKL